MTPVPLFPLECGIRRAGPPSACSLLWPQSLPGAGPTGALRVSSQSPTLFLMITTPRPILCPDHPPSDSPWTPCSSQGRTITQMWTPESPRKTSPCPTAQVGVGAGEESLLTYIYRSFSFPCPLVPPPPRTLHASPSPAPAVRSPLL